MINQTKRQSVVLFEGFHSLLIHCYWFLSCNIQSGLTLFFGRPVFVFSQPTWRTKNSTLRPWRNLERTVCTEMIPIWARPSSSFLSSPRSSRHFSKTWWVCCTGVFVCFLTCAWNPRGQRKISILSLIAVLPLSPCVCVCEFSNKHTRSCQPRVSSEAARDPSATDTVWAGSHPAWSNPAKMGLLSRPKQGKGKHWQPKI